ncbi:extracellular catalytic domain type 1 short-chain-length polyhydroxyalkanoate depolymerase [Exilibacterium tricleocarpae]|uniref:extracellular catalytic domain type 1 short-chain-length polyhydroxyalkanoate depolymerase n=1 Tax=Exilibacterium tricleocarpae TaxID=2591008 RepID=UPI0015D21D2A|nr:PHB depolymerase family esterase [Exilibacterium tricleocarpae]
MIAYLERIKQPLRRLKAIGPSAPRGETHDRVSQRHDYPGSQSRHYSVYVPPGYRRDKPLPLVMVLHGCRQDHRDIQLVSDFDCVADRYNFIVVYPFVTRYTDLRARNCWGWWRPEQIKPGAGEVEDLWRIVGEVAGEFAIDQRRVHIAGLSSGGAMAVAALTVHAGRFASGAAVAGVPYGESASAVALPYTLMRRYRPLDTTVALMEKARDSDRTPAPICIVHSHNDDTVHIQAGKNLRDSWIEYFGPQKKLSKRKRKKSTHGVPWSHTRYGKRFGKSVVETIFLAGPDHGWYGGSPGRFSYPAGPDVSKLLWKFFRKHRLMSDGTTSGVAMRGRQSDHAGFGR